MMSVSDSERYAVSVYSRFLVELPDILNASIKLSKKENRCGIEINQFLSRLKICESVL
jgi:hypothetical protein